MTQPKVPEPFSVEYYVERFRLDADKYLLASALAAVGNTANYDGDLPDGERLQQIRNIIDAVNQVQAERRQGPVHFQLMGGDAACRLDPLPTGHSGTDEIPRVTCTSCLRSLKVAEPVSGGR